MFKWLLGNNKKKNPDILPTPTPQTPTQTPIPEYIKNLQSQAEQDRDNKKREKESKILKQQQQVQARHQERFQKIRKETSIIISSQEFRKELEEALRKKLEGQFKPPFDITDNICYPLKKRIPDIREWGEEHNIALEAAMAILQPFFAEKGLKVIRISNSSFLYKTFVSRFSHDCSEETYERGTRAGLALTW